jgi:hypothetical protein
MQPTQLASDPTTYFLLYGDPLVVEFRDLARPRHGRTRGLFLLEY